MKLLSLHGGGMLGYITLCYLHKLEMETGKKVPEMFDMISGDSTGSIIAAGYAGGLSTIEMINLYEKMRDRIFGKKAGFIKSLFKPVYEIENLYAAIHDSLKDKKLKDAKVKTMIHAVRMSKDKVYKTKFWKSWEESGEETLANICTASCAVPGGFKPFELHGEFYIDGAIATNNPSMNMVADVLKMGVNPNNIKVVSMWTEEYPPMVDPSTFYGLIKVIPKLNGMFLQAGEDIVDYQAKAIVGEFIQIRPDATFAIDSDRYDDMRNVALGEFNINGKSVQDLVA